MCHVATRCAQTHQTIANKFPRCRSISLEVVLGHTSSTLYVSLAFRFTGGTWCYGSGRRNCVFPSLLPFPAFCDIDVDRHRRRSRFRVRVQQGLKRAMTCRPSWWTGFAKFKANRGKERKRIGKESISAWVPSPSSSSSSSSAAAAAASSSSSSSSSSSCHMCSLSPHPCL